MQLPYNGRCKITTLFGKKGAWACGWHIGLDMVGLTDKNVRAIADGTITGLNVHGSSYGNSVEIKHADGKVSFYAHLKTVKVRKGQSVKSGDEIGVEGATGNATGSHLHLEIHQGAYKYPAKGTSPASCPWLLDPCEVLGIEKKLGEVEEMVKLSKVSLILPNGKKLSVDGVMIDGTNYGALRQVLEALGFEVGWNGKDVVVKG